MYGYNYETTFGLYLLNDTSLIEKAKEKIVEKFPDANLENLPVTVLDDFWQEINHALEYRGDRNSGLELDQETNLKLIQEKYKEFVGRYLKIDTKIYNVTSYKGIPRVSGVLRLQVHNNK
jgi:hypothetical protein